MVPADVSRLNAQGTSEMDVDVDEQVFIFSYKCTSCQHEKKSLLAETEPGLTTMDIFEDRVESGFEDLTPPHPEPEEREILMTPAPTSEPAESPAVPTAGHDGTGTATPTTVSAESPKIAHVKLERLIEKQLRLLRKPKTMLTDTTAANKVFDLEALRPFNNQRLANFEKIQVAKQRVEQAPARCKAKMRRLIPKIRPNLDAVDVVISSSIVVLGSGSCSFFIAT